MASYTLTDNHGAKLRVAAVECGTFLNLHAEGYGNPVSLDFHEGRIRLLVNDDADECEPEVIDLEGHKGGDPPDFPPTDLIGGEHQVELEDVVVGLLESGDDAGCDDDLIVVSRSDYDRLREALFEIFGHRAGLTPNDKEE